MSDRANNNALASHVMGELQLPLGSLGSCLWLWTCGRFLLISPSPPGRMEKAWTTKNSCSQFYHTLVLIDHRVHRLSNKIL